MNIRVILVVVSLFAFVGCEGSIGVVAESPDQLASIGKVREEVSSIRSIDFGNFDYVGPESYAKTFRLNDGEKPFVRGKEDGIQLLGVEYHDVTGDQNEEAIVRMTIQTGGSAIPSLVFIYTINEGKPVPLWKFTTGDRADGGLKSVIGENGNLEIELYGKNKLKDGKWITETDVTGAACCPTHFTRFVLGWNGKRFGPGEADILAVPSS